MRNPINNTRKLRLLSPLFCSMTVLIAGQAFAGTPSVSLNADANRGNIAESGRVGYVGGSTRIGVSIDKNMQGQVDVNQIVAEDDASATSVEGWFGYQIKDKNGSEKGVKGGGVKLNHLWADGDGRYQGDTVHKVFGAYDRDANDHAKVTAGYGQEQRDLFWSGHISKGISDKQGNGTGVATKAYDYGVGGEVGTFLEDSLTRIRGALDYEWGTDQADHEDKPTQATISAGVQQYFYDSPHSVTFDVSASKKSGGKSYGETTASNARIGYQYEFGKNGTFQSDRMTKRVRVEVAGTPGRAAIPAIPAIPGKAAQYSKKAISKPYIKLVKTTMKLENETFFKLNKATLTSSAKENLLKIAAEIRRSRYTGAIRITGNTCGLGSAKYDQILSERRARSVRKFLISEGFNPAHLVARGLGKAHPKYPNGPASGFKNRRVDIEYVTQRSVKKKMYRTEYKNVLVTAATSGTPGRAGVAGIAGTPARFIWKTEEIKTAPLWIKRALRNPIRHKRSVDTYQTSTVAPVVPVDDNFTLTSRDGMLDVLGNDGAGLTLTQIVAAPAHGTAVIVDGKIKYTANADYVGNDRFTYEVKDAYGKTQTAVVNIVVPEGAHNVAPTAVNDELTTYMGTAVSQDIIANDKDDDGDTLTLATVSDPSFGTVSQNGNIITYTPEAGFSGTDTFTYTVFDGKGHEATATVTVIVTADTNKAPEAVNDAFSTDENTAKTYDVLGNDTDSDGDTLEISAKTDGSHGTVEIVDNKVKYTPETDYSGTDTFTYTISDGKDHTATATVTVTIEEEAEENSDPEASDDTYTTYVNTAMTYDVLENDHDDDEDSLTVTINRTAKHGTVKITDNKVEYTPATDYTGSDSFIYMISDGEGGTDTATVNITIEAAGNKAPEANDDAFETPVNTAKTYDVLGNDTDEDDDNLTITGTTGSSHAGITIDSNKIVYAPNKDFSGTDTFKYSISDGEGNTATATVTVTVVADSGVPVLSPNYAATYGDIPVTIRVLDDDTDPDGDTLSLTRISTQPEHGTATLDADKVIYKAEAGYTGSDSFRYEVTDSNGHTLSELVKINVKQARNNTSPTANADNHSMNTKYYSSTTIDVLHNDTDPDNDNLSIQSVTTSAKDGTTKIVGSKIVYTPKAGFKGQDSFSYTISDSAGNKAVGKVHIEVIDEQHVGATDDVIYTDVDTPINNYNLVSNDYDVDGHRLSIKGASCNDDFSDISLGGSNVTINASKTGINYVPDEVGVFPFDYLACDAEGNYDDATVTIHVVANSTNNAPELGADSYSNIKSGSTIERDVLANDTDPDGDTLTLQNITEFPIYGLVSINANKITYTADSNYTGTDNFTYSATDGYGHLETATVSLTITSPANTKPTIKFIPTQYINSEKTTIDLSSYINDADGDTVHISSASSNSGSLDYSSYGTTIQYTPIDLKSGEKDTIYITVQDSHGEEVSSSFNIRIN